ncbi:MAG: ABC transporter ATP-binding protein [Ramlibacter sp.]|nr:ABC transporter ATP-binding protein [Ramlibacter sp.]
MASDIAISVEGLSKCYRVGHQAVRAEHPTLRDQIVRHARDLARKTRDMASGQAVVQGDTVEDFWALRDVSFEIPRGGRVGILGRNGAGKSTLLKLLSRITEPTSGRIQINGRVASLLEVGTGFHPELTGRENIFLNGAILGMSRREIQGKFDEIVAFAEVERFLDTPVKRYSSGMYVRLAFAVAAHLEPEILIVDEVLAVGDAQFQAKCLGKMKDVGSEGRTVIFVSHNLAAISQLCESAIYLRSGQLLGHASVELAIGQYMNQEANNTGLAAFSAAAHKDVAVIEVEILDGLGKRRTEFSTSDDIRLRFRVRVQRAALGGRVGFRVLSADGVCVFSSEDVDSLERPLAEEPGDHDLVVTLPAGLVNEGSYFISLAGHVPNIRWLFREDDVLRFKVHSTYPTGTKPLGFVHLKLNWAKG